MAFRTASVMTTASVVCSGCRDDQFIYPGTLSTTRIMTLRIIVYLNHLITETIDHGIQDRSGARAPLIVPRKVTFCYDELIVAHPISACKHR